MQKRNGSAAGLQKGGRFNAFEQPVSPINAVNPS
jgi:hypothetical protein